MSSDTKRGGQKKPAKVQQASKKDKAQILDALLTNPTVWDAVESLDAGVLKRSVHNILNSLMQYDPDAASGNRTIDEVLRSTHTVFRFAPAPSGELHIGHVVPILLNIILSKINRDYGYRSSVILRIDDTDPDPDATTDATATTDTTAATANFSVTDTLAQFIPHIATYRSSDHSAAIVDSVIGLIRCGDLNFYPDLSTQAEIKEQRAARVASPYREAGHDDMIQTLDSIISGETPGTIRAKIDPASDNGNLRDPVVIRSVVHDKTTKMCPMYDLVCPVLDLYDAKRYASETSCTLFALRDANYYDRLDQYTWIQNAMRDCSFLRTVDTAHDARTAMCTFSRINLEGAVLSKRKIKALIEGGNVMSWADPRLFTVPGIISRGVPIPSLCNFYWIAGKMSMSNRTSTETQESFFSLNDKVLCRTNTPIIARLRDSDDVDDDVTDTLYAVNVISYAIDVDSASGATAATAGAAGAAAAAAAAASTAESTDADTIAHPKSIGKFRIDRDQLIPYNVGSFRKLTFDWETLNSPGHKVMSSQEYADLSPDVKGLFCLGMQLDVGTVIKINNFKDGPEQMYPGFYVIRQIDSKSKRIVVSHVA